LCSWYWRTIAVESSTSTSRNIQPQKWTAEQIIEAFPEDTAPRYLIRDRDGVYGCFFNERLDGIRIKQVLIAARSPWQNSSVERIIGSIRRECLNHVIVFNHRHLRRILKSYFPLLSRFQNASVLRTGRENRTRQSHARFSRRSWEESFRFPRSVDCIIATNAALPKCGRPIMDDIRGDNSRVPCLGVSLLRNAWRMLGAHSRLIRVMSIRRPARLSELLQHCGE
jgi:hypothetical protein